MAEHKRSAISGSRPLSGYRPRHGRRRALLPRRDDGLGAQASLEKVNRILLQNHLETCVASAVAEGRTAEIVEELMETMKYTAAVTGPAPISEESAT